MSEKTPKHFPLAGTVGESFFTFQRDDYSCGPASMTTVCNLLGVDVDYDTVRGILAPDPVVGTAPDKMTGLAGRILPLGPAGDLTYEGGVAIANIVLEGEGHYVVFLAKEQDDVLFYEPFYHELVLQDINTIEWSKGEDGEAPRNEWSASFTAEERSISDWLKLAEPKDPAAKTQPKHKPPPKTPAP